LLLDHDMIVLSNKGLTLGIIEEKTVDSTVKTFNFNIIFEVPLDDHHTPRRLLHYDVNDIWI
jgi:hypothetical protein